MMMNDTWQEIGFCGVDAGLIWFGDPCYLSDDSPFTDWSAFCNTIDDENSEGAQQYNYKMGHAGLGVLIKDFDGDGNFPVYVKRDKQGLVTAAMIVFQD